MIGLPCKKDLEIEQHHYFVCLILRFEKPNCVYWYSGK